MTTATDTQPATPATQGGVVQPSSADAPDPRLVVRAVFPAAFAANSRLGGRWTVSTPEPQGWPGVLGDGATEMGAWEDAAEAVEQARSWGWGGQRRARGRAGKGAGGRGVGQGRDRP
jgi:hypothetical protein